MLRGELLLLPTPISESEVPGEILAPAIKEAVLRAKILFVEHPKTVRRLIKKFDSSAEIDSFQWIEIGKRKDREEIEAALLSVAQGSCAAVLSEAGMPCIGDPGFEIVEEAHQMGIKVVPYPGPNSFLMALMASGFSGQAFTFHGYVPLKDPLRGKKIQDWEKRALQSGAPQIFMETPYRNNTLLRDLLSTCGRSTMLSISCDLMGKEEKVITANIGEWKTMDIDLPKLPAVFILGRESRRKG